MNDYIKRSDAYMYIHAKYPQLLNARLHRVIDSIPQAWIPVQDILPDDGEHVLCYSEIYGVNEAVARQGKHHLLFLDAQEENFEFTYVTHWMEMPAPPEGA